MSENPDEHQKADQTEYDTTGPDMHGVGPSEEPDQATAYQENDQQCKEGQFPAKGEGGHQQDQKGTGICNQMRQISVQKRHEENTLQRADLPGSQTIHAQVIRQEQV